MSKEQKNSLTVSADIIKSKIYTLRGMQVMLDKDLAELYGVLTGNLNKAVKRNNKRFPTDFMFQLSTQEFENLRFQIGISSWGGLRALPYAFTEQGVTALSGVLKSPKAIEINIQIVRAFVAMRRFISSNAQIFHRLDRVEQKQVEYDQKFEEVFDAIQNKDIKLEKGIFFDGQIFDAYKFVSDLIRSAEKSIILIDNYVDDSVLTLLSKRKKEVRVVIFTKEVSKQLALDVAKYNSQYPPIEVREFLQAHDRFLIIDDTKIYHFGASLKDLGKKWFAFSTFDKEVFIAKDINNYTNSYVFRNIVSDFCIKIYVTYYTLRDRLGLK